MGLVVDLCAVAYCRAARATSQERIRFIESCYVMPHFIGGMKTLFRTSCHRTSFRWESETLLHVYSTSFHSGAFNMLLVLLREID
jgi:hypothetical protein